MSVMVSLFHQAMTRWLRPRGTPPFDSLAGTPLDRVADNYLAIITGSVLFPGTGSALVLRPGLAVTSAHVVEGCAGLTALSRHGLVELHVLGRSRRLDLAVLAVPEGLGRTLPIARAAQGQAVWAMGTTTGWLAPTASGRVETDRATAWLDRVDGPGHAGLMYAAEAGPGYSGGPVVNASGALVGLTEGIYTELFDKPSAAWPQLPRLFAYHAADVWAESLALQMRTI